MNNQLDFENINFVSLAKFSITLLNNIFCETHLTLDFTRKTTLMTNLPADITEPKDAVALGVVDEFQKWASRGPNESF